MWSCLGEKRCDQFKCSGGSVNLMKGIIFDCDGTLVDSESAHFLSWKHVLEKRGKDFHPGLYSPYVGYCSKMFGAEVFGMGADESLHLYDEKRKFYQDLLSKGFSPMEEMVSFVKLLAQQKEQLGLKLGVASGASKLEILENLRHLGILSVFDAIVSGQDDLDHYTDPRGVNKPQPYVYLEAARLLGVEPSKCIAFEDSRTGLQAALQAGMKAVAVPNIFTQTHDFSGATRILKPFEPIDLLEMLSLYS